MEPEVVEGEVRHVEDLPRFFSGMRLLPDALYQGLDLCD
jgi:hypothetical protein